MQNDPVKGIWGKLRKQASESLGERFWGDLSDLFPRQEPAVDMFESNGLIVVVVELPGFQSADQIRLSTDGKKLYLSGEDVCNYGIPEKELLWSERWFGKFERTLALPSIVYTDGIRAKLSHGLLYVSLVKKPEDQVKPIPVETDEQ